MDCTVIRQGSSGLPPPWLLELEQLVTRASFPGQGFAKNTSCASAALHEKCSLWHLSFLLSLQWDSGYSHCLVALSTDFCTSALPWAVGFLQEKLGAVALLSFLGVSAGELGGTRWGKKRTGAAVVVMSEQEMPKGLPHQFLLRQIGKVVKDRNLKHRS